MKSIGQMIEALDCLRDTTDITPWENGFITSILTRYLEAGKSTSGLSAKQVETVGSIYNKHFR